MFLRKNPLASSKPSLSLLEVNVCLTLILFFNLKHILSNEAVIHGVLEDFIFYVEASKGYGLTLRPTSFFGFR